MSEIPGYTILRPLGQGGMATVYLALQQSLGREVALKVLASKLAQDADASERFLREARLAANLHHPHIVPIHDVGMHEGVAYIAMQFEPGGTVSSVAGVCDSSTALRIIRDIATALDYAHGKGVVHRDIKPDNILRRTDGSCVLSDFGIARVIESETALTREGTSIGTPQYMSPEQLRGEKVDGRADLYSLGVVLYQLLTGDLPYAGSDGWAIGMQHINADIPRLPPAMERLQPLVDSLMAKKPEARLQTGAEVVRQIDALLSFTTPAPTVPLEAASSKPRRLVSRNWLLLGAISLVLAVGVITLWKLGRGNPDSHQPAIAILSPGSTLAPAADKSIATPVAMVANPKSIAVLPFESLSSDKDNAYFASGMQGMILTKLAAIGDLKVISRTSTEKYESHPDDLKTIAKQLGVATILEGSVQKSGNQVLINVQLIDAASDNHLWAEAYPRTLDNVFGVEGEVAQKVAEELKAKLTPAESARVATAPTRNAAAYDAFLKAEYQAEQATVTAEEATYLTADVYYRQAIALDPGFALAYSNLAYNEVNRHWTASKLSTSELAGVKTLIDRALALAPDLPEAHMALGYYYYWGFRHYEPAIVELQRALQLAPRNILALQGLAYVSRRTGQLPQALAYLQKALLISPRDGYMRAEYGTTFALLRRYAEAYQQLKLSLEIDPTDATAKDWLLITDMFGYGDVPGERDAYRSPPGWRISNQNLHAGDVFFLINPRVYPDIFDRHFAEALRAWDAAPTSTPEERLTGQVARVVIQVIAGQRQSAQAKCGQLASQMEAERSRQPDSLSLLQQVSWVDVCLGRNDQAVAAAKRATVLLPIGKDTYYGTFQLVGLAQIDAWADAPDDALNVIRQLQAIPAGGVMSIERLKLDPVWDPLRKDPRFQKLIADGEAAEKAQPKP